MGTQNTEKCLLLVSGEQQTAQRCREAESGGPFERKRIHVEFRLFGKTAVRQQAGVFRERGRAGLAELGTESTGSVLAELFKENMCVSSTESPAEHTPTQDFTF